MLVLFYIIMKLNRDCRFGSDCRKNQSKNCPYMHPRQHKHHSKQQSYQPDKRERSRQVQLRRGEKKYPETKHKQNQHQHKQIQHHQDRKRRERRQKSPEVQYKSRQYKHHYDKEEPRHQQKSKNQVKYELKNQQKPEVKLQEKLQPKQQVESSKQPNQTSNKSQPLIDTARLALQKQFSQFCPNFHLENRCENKQNCEKLHSFLFKDCELVRRKIFQQSLKLTGNPILATNVDSQGISYIVRTENQLGNYYYRPTKNQIQGPVFISMEQFKSTKKIYFACQASMLYFSYADEDFGLYSLLLHNIPTNKQFIVKNAHVKEVTGITQLGNNKFLTVSLDGIMKVWNLDNKQLTWVIDNQATQKYRNLYNPDGKAKQLNFVQKMTLGQKNLICVGSGDSKLLFFIDQDPLSFKEIKVSQNQLKILKIKKINQNTETLDLLVLALSNTKSFIYRIQTDLNQPPHKIEKLIQLENQDGKTINTFQSHEDYLFVSYGKEIVFYSLENPNNILGGIMHSSPINNLAVTTYLLKQTGVKFHILAVLEGSGGQQKKGTLSIYFIQ